jgi:uncharacterized membrane protein
MCMGAAWIYTRSGGCLDHPARQQAIDPKTTIAAVWQCPWLMLWTAPPLAPASMMIDDFILARAVHLLALVHWIGGVAMVATIVLPRARALPDVRAALAAFEAFERRFVAQVRLSILLAGLSGFYMLNKMQAWEQLLDPAFWWLMLMVAVWAVFALMVFVLEPLVVHRLFSRLRSARQGARIRARNLVARSSAHGRSCCYCGRCAWCSWCLTAIRLRRRPCQNATKLVSAHRTLRC